jgi:hypothetical protein
MGPDGDLSFESGRPSVAYNPRADQYLAVWSGNAVGEEYEIWGRLLDARGTPLGGQLRISAVGPDGDPDFQATEPAVAYNARTNEYLVAWQGWDLGQTSGEEEVFVQRLTATGAEVGADDARISVTGPDGDLDFDAQDPAVAANGASGEYLVAWRGDVAEGEDEVFAQRLDPAGSQVGADDLRLSDMGPEGDTRFDAGAPAVAHNGRTGEYLVAWHGAEAAAGDVEIHVQRLDAGGAETGANDQRISDTGAAFARAAGPAVAASERSGEYLVAWDGDDSPPLAGGEREIFVQRLDPAGAEVGADDRRISDMGPDGDRDALSSDASVAYDFRSDEYLVAWMGRNPPELALRKDEVFAQRLDATGAETGAQDMRVSVMGADDDPDFSGLRPAVAYGSQANEYLLAWEGGDLNAPDVDNESEVYERRVGAGAPPAPPAAVCRTLPPPPAATAGDPKAVTLSEAQLLINQRIDQAAIRRANGVQAWLDAGVEARDVCQGAIGRSELRPEVVTGFTSLQATLGPPAPRPVPVRPAGKPDPDAVTLTVGQVLINQRISQAAIRRLNALKARLDAGLTGGDVTDGQLGLEQLVAGTAILVAPPPAGPPAPSATRIAPAGRGDPGKVTLTVSQLLINQRISQAGVRRANDLIRRLDAGLGAAEIADGSLTGADLAPGLALATR